MVELLRRGAVGEGALTHADGEAGHLRLPEVDDGSGGEDRHPPGRQGSPGCAMSGPTLYLPALASIALSSSSPSPHRNLHIVWNQKLIC